MHFVSQITLPPSEASRVPWGGFFNGLLGSLNGIFINGERVKKAAFRGGDVLRLGHMILRFIRKTESSGAKTDL
jgi:pSer/pThr/pTyr-binding forkhead associated (FHA) protein